MFAGFGKIRNWVLPVVFLRRISRALEDQNKLLARRNELAEIQLSITHPAAYKAFKANRGRVTRVAEISVAKIEDWNRQWEEAHPTHEEEERW